MTVRPDRTSIELAFFVPESRADIALRFKTSADSIREIWKRAKRAGRLPKIPRRLAIKRNRA